MLEDLQPETLYSISMAAYTIKGDGAQSVSRLVRTPVACESPVCVCFCLCACVGVCVCVCVCFCMLKHIFFQFSFLVLFV